MSGSLVEGEGEGAEEGGGEGEGEASRSKRRRLGARGLTYNFPLKTRLPFISICILLNADETLYSGFNSGCKFKKGVHRG